MERTVYVDIYFMINFGMDFLCLFLTSRLLSLKISPLRFFAAAAVGGAYACATLLLDFGALLSLAIHAAVCMAICATAFLKKGELRHLPANSLVFAAVSVLLGGGMTALFEIFNKIGLDRMLGSEEDADGISVWLFLLLALLCGLGASISGKRILRMAACKKCRLEICFGKSAKSFSALCDNGNMLREPISAKLCVIIELSAAREMLPHDMVAAIEQRRADLLSPENARRLRVIPVSTVSGGGMMYAFRMDGVRIDAGKGFREVDALAAFCTEKIKEGVDALVPAELILNQ